MKYTDLIDAHLGYGTTKKDIEKREGFENVLENVVLHLVGAYSLSPLCEYEIVPQIIIKLFSKN